MNTVLALIILLNQNNLKNDVMYIISGYIIDHMQDMDNMSIKQLSEECFTSTTSVIKFCQLLGFHSYSDFKRNLLSTFQTRKLQLIEKFKYVTVDEFINRIQGLSTHMIDKIDFLNRIDQIVYLIKKQKKIHMYGAVFPLELTQSFCEDMAVMGIPIHVYQVSFGDNHFVKREGLNIIVTLSGRYMEANRNEYRQLCEMNDSVALISQEKDYIGNVTLNIPLPKSISSDYDDLIYLLILDMIKLRYYQNVYDCLI